MGLAEAGQGAKVPRGEAGEMQVPGAELVGLFNMGGFAASNYVSILERTR